MKLLLKIIFIFTGLLFVIGMSYKIGIGAAYGKFDWGKLAPEEARKTLGATLMLQKFLTVIWLYQAIKLIVEDTLSHSGKE